MRRFTCVFLIVLSLSLSANALSLVSGSYDNDQWEVEQVDFFLPKAVPDGWYPLKKTSDYLGEVYVSWDEKNRKISVCSNDLSWFYIEEFDVNNLPEYLMIEDGVTYCSPEYLASLVSNHGFYYEGGIYYFSEETTQSMLIDTGDNDFYRKRILTILYQMKIIFPDVYEFVRENLTGGISLIQRSELPYKFSYEVDRNLVVGYVNVANKTPICYVVQCFYNNKKENLASVIAHEACHVYCFKTSGNIGEEIPTKYENYVKNLFLEIG